MPATPTRRAPIDLPETASLHDRRGFELRLDEAIGASIRLRASVGLLLIAIDRFTVFARSPAPQTAEAVLAAAVQRIRPCLRVGDVIGRPAADRLVLLLTDCDEEAMAAAAARFIEAVSGQPMVTAAGPVSASVAAGGVILPRHARNAESAMARADAALADALAGAGPVRLRLFAPSAET